MKVVNVSTLNTAYYIGVETVYDGQKHEIVKMIQSQGKADVISVMKIRSINEMNLSCSTSKQDFLQYFIANNEASEWFKQLSGQVEPMTQVKPDQTNFIEKIKKMNVLIQSYDKEVKNIKTRFKNSLSSMEKINKQNENIITGLRETVNQQEKELEQIRQNYNQLLQKYIKGKIDSSEKANAIEQQTTHHVVPQSQKPRTPFTKENLNDDLFDKTNVIHSPFQIKTLNKQQSKVNNFKVPQNSATSSTSIPIRNTDTQHYIDSMPASQRKLVEDYLLMRSIENNTDPLNIYDLELQQLMGILIEVEQHYHRFKTS